MKRETGRWVRKAEADLEGANDLAQAVRPYHDLICFHCQQSAEKYLKAFLQEHRVVFPRTHSLIELLEIVMAD